MKKFMLTLYELLTTTGVRFILRKLGLAVGGIWGWLLSEIIVTILDKLAKPLFLLVARKTTFLKDVFKGKQHAAKLEEATTPEEYLDALNSDK